MLIMMGIHPMKAVNVKWMKIYYRTVKGRTEKKNESASLSNVNEKV